MQSKTPASDYGKETKVIDRATQILCSDIICIEEYQLAREQRSTISEMLVAKLIDADALQINSSKV